MLVSGVLCPRHCYLILGPTPQAELLRVKTTGGLSGQLALIHARYRCDSREYRLIARYRRNRLYLWRTTGHSPMSRFKTRATVSPNAVSEPEANLLAARTVKPMKPIR